MRRLALVLGAASAALGLSGCMSTGIVAPPTGNSSEAALEAYRIYASRCSSHIALPLVASHTCERLQPQQSQSDMVAAVVKALVDAGVIQKPAPAP